VSNESKEIEKRENEFRESLNNKNWGEKVCFQKVSEHCICT
jgi:hypothetical protein